MPFSFEVVINRVIKFCHSPWRKHSLNTVLVQFFSSVSWLCVLFCVVLVVLFVCLFVFPFLDDKKYKKEAMSAYGAICNCYLCLVLHNKNI